MAAKIQGKGAKNPRALDESHRANSQARRGFPGDRGSKIQKSTNFGGNEKVEGLDFCQREKNHTASMVGIACPDYLFFWIFGFLNTKTSKTRATLGNPPDHFRPNFRPKIQSSLGFLPRAAPAPWYSTRAFVK